MYCIYTNREISEQDSNCEHIIPLSLGGSNEFVIPVSTKFNSELGSKVDGELSNCFTMMFRRRARVGRTRLRYAVGNFVFFNAVDCKRVRPTSLNIQINQL
jgi:hypothetical protein